MKAQVKLTDAEILCIPWAFISGHGYYRGSPTFVIEGRDGLWVSCSARAGTRIAVVLAYCTQFDHPQHFRRVEL